MRLQTAIEYLITYGWAILIVSAVLAGLYSIGVFNPNTYTAQECVLTAGFSCLSFSISSNGILMLNLLQSTTAPVNITAIGCVQNGTTHNTMQAPINPPLNQVYMPIGSNYTFSVQCYTNTGPFSSSFSNIFSGSIIVNYTDDFTKVPNTVYGKIVVKA